ncbi:hypothetical protein NP233_g6231 [Leucocoprinus birnbaumii]|uniref:NADH dehydrogenase [ubiquinone] 1 alpha subcomplex subunit n=1 Tax=Leucocoprinus birnbaumii TaxID=56174 RepID=A0AAD5VU64_9AGAR|nr:hypothetical protein NP233_g6231 [Leucocoprinus birnbaumii]
MSLIRRFLDRLRNPARYVGRDLEGNSFYEQPGFSSDRRTKRTVQYKNPTDVWNYIGGGKRLPVQWSMWLSHTRNHPPTLEELQRDLQRQQRVIANAALLEARDLEERQERLRIEQSLREETAKRIQIEEPATGSSDHVSEPPVEKNVPSPSRKGLAPAADEPESWSPQTLRRRG